MHKTSTAIALLALALILPLACAENTLNGSSVYAQNTYGKIQVSPQTSVCYDQSGICLHNQLIEVTNNLSGENLVDAAIESDSPSFGGTLLIWRKNRSVWAAVAPLTEQYRNKTYNTVRNIGVNQSDIILINFTYSARYNENGTFGVLYKRYGDTVESALTALNTHLNQGTNPAGYRGNISDNTLTEAQWDALYVKPRPGSENDQPKILKNMVPTQKTWKKGVHHVDNVTGKPVFSDGFDDYINYTWTQLNDTSWKLDYKLDSKLKDEINTCNQILAKTAKDECITQMGKELMPKYDSEYLKDDVDKLTKYPVTVDPKGKLSGKGGKDSIIKVDKTTINLDSPGSITVDVPNWEDGLEFSIGSHTQFWITSTDCIISSDRLVGNESLIVTCNIVVNNSAHFILQNVTFYTNETAHYQYSMNCNNASWCLINDTTFTWWGAANYWDNLNINDGAVGEMYRVVTSTRHWIYTNTGNYSVHDSVLYIWGTYSAQGNEGIIIAQNLTLSYFEDWYASAFFNWTLHNKSGSSINYRYPRPSPFGVFYGYFSTSGGAPSVGYEYLRFFPICFYKDNGTTPVGAGLNASLWNVTAKRMESSAYTDSNGCVELPAWTNTGYTYYANVRLENMSYRDDLNLFISTRETSNESAGTSEQGYQPVRGVIVPWVMNITPVLNTPYNLGEVASSTAMQFTIFNISSIASLELFTNESGWSSVASIASFNSSSGAGNSGNNTITYNWATKGIYKWAIRANDSEGNTWWSTNYSIVTGGFDAFFPSGDLLNPIDIFNYTVGNITFSCNASDNQVLSNITLWTNISGIWAANVTNTTGLRNVTSWLYSQGGLSTGSYGWNCLITDLNNQSLWAGANRTVNIDVDTPNIWFEPPTPGDGTTTSNTSITIFINLSSASDIVNLSFMWNTTPYTYLNNSLALLLNFNNNSLIGENTTLAVDASPYHRDAKLITTDWNQTGKYGGSILIEGTGDILNLTSSISMNSLYTICTWTTFPLTSSAGSWRTLTRGDDTNHHIIVNVTGYLGMYDSAWRACSPQTYVQNYTGWHHLCVVGYGAQSDFYLDGAYICKSAAKGTGLLKYIGNYQETSRVQEWGASIDDFTVWTRNLSVDEINQTYKSSLQKTGDTTYQLYINQTILNNGTFTYLVNVTDWISHANSTSRTITLGEIGGADVTAPVVNLQNPVNVFNYSLSNVSFQCNASDGVALQNITLWTNISGTFAQNASNTTGIDNLSIWSHAETVADGVWGWNCLATDATGNSAFAGANRTVRVDTTGPSIILGDPIEQANLTSSPVSYTYTPVDPMLKNCSLYINLSGVWTLNDTNNAPTQDTLNTFSEPMTDGSYSWNIRCWDTLGNTAYAAANRTFTLTLATIADNVSPVVDLQNPVNLFNYTLSNITFQCNASDDRVLSRIDLYTNLSTICYQEFANVSTSCGGLNTGSYASTGDFTEPTLPLSNAYDGNWSSSARSDTDGYIYINYTKPVFALPSSSWVVKTMKSGGGDITLNYTIPLSCFSQDILSFWVNLSNPNFKVSLNCKNSTSWVLIANYTGVGYPVAILYEEAMYWNMSMTINATNTTGLANGSIWSHSETVPDGSYGWTCSATDTTDNKAFASANRTLTVDTTKPTVTLGVPVALLNTTQKTNFQFNYTPSDTNLKNCSLWINASGTFALNKTASSPTSGVENSIYLNITNDGNYLWNVQCYDSLSNMAFASANKTFTVDTLPPVVVPNRPIWGYTYGYKTNFQFNYSVFEPNIANCSLLLSNSPNHNTTEFNPQTTNAVWVYNYFYVNMTDGNWVFEVNCTDTTGNWNISNAYINGVFQIDSTPPVVSLFLPEDYANFTSGTELNFTVNATEDDYLYQCELWSNKTGTFGVTTQPDPYNSVGGGLFNITETFPDGNYLWNIRCRNVVELPEWVWTYASANRTFTVNSVTSTCTPTSNTNWVINATEWCHIINQDIHVYNVSFIENGGLWITNSNITSTSFPDVRDNITIAFNESSTYYKWGIEL